MSRLDSSQASTTKAQASLLWAPLLTIMAAAFSVEIPFLFLGTPSGHDVEFHLYSWLEVLAQWKHGIFYPRWASLAHFAYGEPRFVFYPPASWTLGALLSAILPWTLAASAYVWLGLTAGGISMFLLVRRWFDRRDAIFTAVLYTVNPYALVTVYWRSSFAEMLGACLIPLLVLLIVKAVEDGENVTIPLGFVLAGGWLINAPAAVMIHYSLALLVVAFVWRTRSPRLLLISVGAVALGVCLSAFYLLPAVYEQRWINIAEAVSQGSRPADNFLFIHTTDADHDAFNHLISWIAVLEMAILFVAGILAKTWRAQRQALWIALLAWTAACSVLLLPISLVLWDFLPKLQFMQFPWRWLLCLSVLFAIFVTVGFQRWWARAAVLLVSLIVIIAVWHKIQAPWWDNAGDLREMQDNMAAGTGYEGTDEYTPAGADPSTLDKDARKVTVNGPAHAVLRVLRWDPESKIFTAEMSAADQLALRLFFYPAWRAEVNGHPVETAAREGTGHMLVPVTQGTNRVEITFIRTWDRTAGGWISALTLLFAMSYGVRTRHRNASR